MACIIWGSLYIYIRSIWPQMLVEHNRRSIGSGSSSRSLGREWEDMILPGHENPYNCVDPQHLGKSEWDKTLGKIECVFSLYDKMRSKSDDVYLPRGLPNMYSTSLSPPLLPLYLSTPAITHEQCTSRLWSSELRDALGGRDWVNSEMHLEAEIEWTQRCTWRPRLSELRDALGDRDWVNSEMHCEAVIERVSTCTWRPRSSELSDALRAMIEQVWTCTCRLRSSEIGGVLGSSRLGRRRDGSWDSIHWLTCNCGYEESWVQQHPPRDERLTGSGW